LCGYSLIESAVTRPIRVIRVLFHPAVRLRFSVGKTHMMSTRWRKVVRELWSNRTRTLLVIASIAVGIFAVGTVQLLRSVILTELQAVYANSNASQATILTDGVDEATLDAIRRMPEVADAQGRSNLGVKVEVAPDQWEGHEPGGDRRLRRPAHQPDRADPTR
jgi:hypothetical protein